MKTTATQTLAGSILIIALFTPTIIPPSNASTTLNNTFSVIWITDTQYLSESHPQSYTDLCSWIEQNKETYNIKMVIHTGDIVNDEGNQTQWLNANQSMGILLDNDVPYCWNAGNHDYNTSYWIGNHYASFNPDLMQTKPYWVSDKFDGMNTAVRFKVGDWECLIINVAFNANQTVVSWVNNILDSNPEAHAIVVMHMYLNKEGKYDEWATNFKKVVLDTHSNVFLTLSAHYYPTEGKLVEVGERFELLFNPQAAYEGVGAASARILTFDVLGGTIDVQTYLVHSDEFMLGSNNAFTLATNFRNDLAGKSLPVWIFVVALVVVLCCGLGLGFVVRGRVFTKKKADMIK